MQKGQQIVQFLPSLPHSLLCRYCNSGKFAEKVLKNEEFFEVTVLIFSSTFACLPVWIPLPLLATGRKDSSEMYFIRLLKY